MPFKVRALAHDLPVVAVTGTTGNFAETSASQYSTVSRILPPSDTLSLAPTSAPVSYTNSTTATTVATSAHVNILKDVDAPPHVLQSSELAAGTTRTMIGLLVVFLGGILAMLLLGYSQQIRQLRVRIWKATRFYLNRTRGDETLRRSQDPERMIERRGRNPHNLPTEEREARPTGATTSPSSSIMAYQHGERAVTVVAIGVAISSL